MEKQRRDSYLARTLSNMARVRLDHAMALAAEKDGPPEKWEMRCARSPAIRQTRQFAAIPSALRAFASHETAFCSHVLAGADWHWSSC